MTKFFGFRSASLSDPQTDYIETAIQNRTNAVVILDSLFQTYDREMREIGDSLSLAILEYADVCDSSFLQKMHEKSVERWNRLLDYGIARGEFLPVKKDAFISLFLYSYQGFLICNRFLTDDSLPAAILPHLRQMLILEERK